MLLHPVIRILCFLILVTYLASMHLPDMLLLTAFFFAFASKNFRNHMSVLSRFVWRLRWFWLSILILYSLLPLNVSTSSTYAVSMLVGLSEGLVRCLALLLVIMYFVLLVHPIPLEQLQQSWYWIIRPLRFVGINPEVISMRIALTFHAVRELQTVSMRPEQKLSFRQLPQSLFEFMQLAIEKSAAQAMHTVQEEQPLRLPQPRQWWLPVGLLIVLSLLRYYQPLQTLQHFI